MTAYILEVGEFDDVHVVGVYTSPELAMSALPRDDWASMEGRAPWWQSVGTRYGDRATIHGFMVDACPQE